MTMPTNTGKVSQYHLACGHVQVEDYADTNDYETATRYIRVQLYQEHGAYFVRMSYWKWPSASRECLEYASNGLTSARKVFDGLCELAAYKLGR